VRAYEAFRLRGLPEPTLERRIATGHASLDAVLRRPARVTQVATGVMVATSLAGFFVPGLTELLEKSNDAIRAGEAWRLVTVALVHGGAIHLLFNMSVSLDVGGIVERLCGSLRMLGMFVFGTASGTLASVAAIPYPSVGASGGIFALLGALWAVVYRHRRELPPEFRSRLLRSSATAIALNVVIGFSLPHIDWAAHLGGLAGGVITGLLFGLGPDARAALEPRPGQWPGPV
jgi:membrane associated rhomboid family serine protease